MLLNFKIYFIQMQFILEHPDVSLINIKAFLTITTDLMCNEASSFIPKYYFLHNSEIWRRIKASNCPHEYTKEEVVGIQKISIYSILGMSLLKQPEILIFSGKCIA